jgi:hypothetical protein
MNLNVRSVPPEVHAELLRRAERSGTSLRAYIIRVLEDHCATPTVEEWLDGLPIQGPVGQSLSNLDALTQSREEDDASVVGQ